MSEIKSLTESTHPTRNKSIWKNEKKKKMKKFIKTNRPTQFHIIHIFLSDPSITVRGVYKRHWGDDGIYIYIFFVLSKRYSFKEFEEKFLFFKNKLRDFKTFYGISRNVCRSLTAIYISLYNQIQWQTGQCCHRQKIL